MSRAKVLTDAHWNNYVGPLLTAAGVEEKVVDLCGFIYKSSGIHFYKHCQEDAVEASRGAFANAAAHKEGHKTCGNCGSSTCLQVGRHDDGCCVCWQPNDAAHKAPSLCDSEVEAAYIKWDCNFCKVNPSGIYSGAYFCTLKRVEITPTVCQFCSDYFKGE